MPTSLSELLLEQFSLSELLELNDLTEEEVLEILIEGGLIGQPERLISEIIEISE